MSGAEEILDFWFGDLPAGAPVPAERMALWFGGGEATDRLIRERFAGTVREAAAGAAAAWRQTPRGALALILLLDQFPRNIYRGSDLAYAHDRQAQLLTLAGLAAAQDLRLTIVERAFFYLPLEHAEDAELQAESVAAFSRLLAVAPAALRETCRGFLDYAERHRAIIGRFGRFPHRNAALGRTSTAAEEDFLRQPGASF
jgi:uncharacterized protein (DUF924 family)